MILHLRDLTGREHHLGISSGRYVDAGSAGDPVFDFRHLHAIGGLADCHAHLTGDDVRDIVEYDGDDLMGKMRRNAILQMESGVLLLADKGSKSELSLRFLAEEEAERPILRMAGRMVSVPGGYYPDFCAEVRGNLDEVVTAAAAGGATWIKLVGDWPRPGFGPVANFTEEQLRRVVAIAHNAGCRVAIHTTAPETPGIAVRAGVDSIEHGLFLSAEDVVQLGERGGSWVPTVLAMESIAESLGPDSSGGRLFQRGLANVRSVLAAAVEAGVAVLTGTDLAVPHGAVAREAARLVDYGLSAQQAVRAVTKAAYDYLGVAAGFEVGASADLVLCEADPRLDITALQRPAHVMRAGRVVFSSIV